MKQTKRADQIIALCDEIVQRTVEVYYEPQSIEENKIVFLMHSELPTEFLKELLNDKWWMKWYDRTFYIVSVRDRQFIDIAGIKNTYSKEETDKFLDECYETLKRQVDEKTVDVRAKDGSYENTYDKGE